MAAVDATDCAIEGTVICASRAEGLVERVGSAWVVAASGRGGMARNRAWPAVVAAAWGAATVFFDVTAAPPATGCFATGLPLGAGAAFLAAAAGVFTGAFFLAGTGLAGGFAAALTAAFFTGAFATGLAADFFAAGFAALAALAGAAADFALAAGLVVLAPTFG